MFYGYPIAAVAENWLHECLVEILTAIHVNLDARRRPMVWPTIVPLAHRARLRRRHGLRGRLNAYVAVVRNLNAAHRRQVLTCLNEQNAIADLVRGESNCARLADLPVSIRTPVRNLFEFAFGLLTELGLRDRHYAIIYDASTTHVCPFCCTEYFDAPGAPREDYDHYLAASHYPFAAANLRNLTPMGMKCNERYKIADDILWDDAGIRRRSFDPYANQQRRVSLTNSVPFAQADGQTPDWRIDFIPDSPECVTWDTVFQIRTRLSRDVLDPSFRNWLAQFATWFVLRKGVDDVSDARIIASVGEYAQDAEIIGLTSREFLRAPMFRMIERHCQNGNNRLLLFMRDVVTRAVPQTPPAAA